MLDLRVKFRQKCNTTLQGLRCSLTKVRTPAGGQFGWGGTLLKMYQRGPKVGSTGSEIRCRVEGQKPA